MSFVKKNELPIVKQSPEPGGGARTTPWGETWQQKSSSLKKRPPEQGAKHLEKLLGDTRQY